MRAADLDEATGADSLVAAVSAFGGLGIPLRSAGVWTSDKCRCMR